MPRSLHPSTDGVFDLASEKDALSLLREIHRSPLEMDIKNELRDAVFGFRTTTGAQITPQLTKLFSEHGFTLAGTAMPKQADMSSEAKGATHTKKKTPTFGMSRQVPQFAPSTTRKTISKPESPVAEPEAVHTTEVPASAVPEQSDDTIRGTKQEKATTLNEPMASAAKAVVAETEEVAAETTKETSVPPAAVQPQALEHEQTTPQKDNAPTSAAATQAAVADTAAKKPTETIPEQPVTEAAPAQTEAASPEGGANARIKEIKREVNKMVGNPVNLIDVHNEVGREYMNALLDAMKKSAGGSGSELENAMQRLESAFAAVRETMGVHSRTQAEPAPVDKKESTVPKAEPPEPSKAPSVSPSPTTAAAEASHAVPSKETESAPAAGVVPESSPEAPKPASTFNSVAKEKQVQEMMVAKKREDATTDKQREAAEIAAMDPLMTPEVTNGLSQLLSEWELFKQSGLFGTGPSGIDHPLYKKIAPLPMAAVVAGRFEGVTPQIKRSISEYMNGWRYEEGIQHEQGETFETYLRRVIKHILDKRK